MVSNNAVMLILAKERSQLIDKETLLVEEEVEEEVEVVEVAEAEEAEEDLVELVQKSH